MRSPAFVRAYTEYPGAVPLGSKWKPPQAKPDPDFQLIFDCETTVDAAQALRFGVFQFREQGRLRTTGLFYDPVTMTTAEVELLKRVADERGFWCGNIQAFRDKVFLAVGYEAAASIIGFNLPFDLARIAISETEARRDMRNGFSLSLGADPTIPNARVKHLSGKAALIGFASPAEQRDGRSSRNNGDRTKPHRGTFVDVRTLAAATLSQSHSLASLSKALEVKTPKQSTDEHGARLTEEYIDYALDDVQATWECYEILKQKYQAFGLSTPVEKIMSEASIGKATLSEMYIQPLLKCRPDIPRQHFGTAMASYLGGRAEVRERKRIVEVIQTDFKSMYPTVNALMKNWRFMIAQEFSETDSTEETQAFLERVTLDDLKKRGTWEQLHTLVMLKPDSDILPLRTQYSKPHDKTKNNLTIGLNIVSSSVSMWCTLADVIASKMLTGKTPVIEKAITYQPGPIQDGLKPINLFGNPDYKVDPRTDDLFLKLINLRDGIPKSDPDNLALKILANSTCYGILVEILRDSVSKKQPIDVYGADGLSFKESLLATEEPGKYFNPLLASFITGAARLMLALTERLADDRGLSWAFCDTDSLALARPERMPREEFRERVCEIVDWFAALNPYEKAGSILKIEDVNFDPDSEALKPLFCYAVSAKRYSLFNIRDDGKPIIRKASAHGLGHLLAPYTGELPNPELGNIGVSRWQHDLWQPIICAALAGQPNRVRYDHHPALSEPALQRYGATSPAILRWMKPFNEGKSYTASVKPFGFMTAPMVRTGAFSQQQSENIVLDVKRGRPNKARPPKPIAPFERDPALAARMAFDRETGESVPIDRLKTYREALALYHLSAEDKFENGGPCDIGTTRRRHVLVEEIILIGKEANKVGEAGEIDPICGETLTFNPHRKESKNG